MNQSVAFVDDCVRPFTFPARTDGVLGVFPDPADPKRLLRVRMVVEECPPDQKPATPE